MDNNKKARKKAILKIGMRKKLDYSYYKELERYAKNYSTGGKCMGGNLRFFSKNMYRGAVAIAGRRGGKTTIANKLFNVIVSDDG